MKKFLSSAIALAFFFMASVAVANPPPDPADNGGSPEPAGWMLLMLGVIPAVLVYRRLSAQESVLEVERIERD
ncbi:MAG: hypothetical protein KC561_19020 [Myxococcales bacterium]|nr:hypothetical protein [Myxococcales bacterium]